jgi:threonine dehydrogenase-like Zn-dependent dehydrogenase
MDGAIDNPMTAYISFPHVIGHEVVGCVAQAGARSGVREGQRVLLYPNLSCAMRGLPPCQWCAQGQYAQCLSYTKGSLPPSIHTGNCSTVPGGLAEQLPAHAKQLLALPDEVPDQVAVLADPFAVGLHSVLRAPPPPAGTVVVYGCGTIGLCTIAILRLLYPQVRVIAVARFDHQAALATKLGAHLVLPHAPELQLVERLASETGAELLKPWNGLPVCNGGVDVVYDTVASAKTLEVGVRVTRSRGALCIVGVSKPQRFEWTTIYFKELQLIGSNAFALETIDGETRHGQQWYLDWVRERRVDVSALVTHRFPFAQYKRAFTTAIEQQRAGSVKVVLEYPPR